MPLPVGQETFFRKFKSSCQESDSAAGCLSRDQLPLFHFAGPVSGLNAPSLCFTIMLC